MAQPAFYRFRNRLIGLFFPQKNHSYDRIMDEALLEKLKFPIGRFQWVDRLSDEEIKLYTQQIRNFPTQLEEQIQSLQTEDFQKTYRPGGWKIGQLIHHLAANKVLS